MNDIERLEHAMFRVEKLVKFYLQSPTVTLDMIDSITSVTIQDLETLLDALKDRGMSSKDRSMLSAVTEIFKRPEFKTQKEIERDLKLAKGVNKEEDMTKEIKRLDKETRQLEKSIAEQKGWIAGYKQGYETGKRMEVGQFLVDGTEWNTPKGRFVRVKGKTIGPIPYAPQE